MTRNESFKRRVRARMEKTGERYGAARRALMARVPAERGWIAQPGVPDPTVREATGRGWDEWCALIDAAPGRDAGHTAIAAHLTGTLGVDAWWAQTVTVGYERIRGLRLPYQVADGTFTVSRSKTLPVDAEALRGLLTGDRDALFPSMRAELVSRPSAKNVRMTMEEGTAEFTVAPAGPGRAKVTVSHSRLPDPGAAAAWRDYWLDWLAGLADAAS